MPCRAPMSCRCSRPRSARYRRPPTRWGCAAGVRAVSRRAWLPSRMRLSMPSPSSASSISSCRPRQSASGARFIGRIFRFRAGEGWPASGTSKPSRAGCASIKRRCARDDCQPMIPLSVLDLSPITEGGDAGQALRNSLDLAQLVEALGYRRYWMAEHHNLPGIASAATAVALAHVAAGTASIRVGAGGIMLPNHAPLLIAEQFGTLAALHPGRVELGLGRAPGSDQITNRAIRRNLYGDVDQFPRDVVELMSYFQPAEPGQAVQAVPGAGLEVPIWILGSSTYGAQLAAYLGLPFAFASHFAPAMMMDAIAIYRQRFRPSAQLAIPNVMLGVTVVAAESDEEARFLFSSLQQSTLNNRTGRRGRVPAPVRDFDALLDPYARAILADSQACAVVGAADTVRRGVDDCIRQTAADELMVTANIFDHGKRKRSFEILAELHGGMKQAAADESGS